RATIRGPVGTTQPAAETYSRRCWDEPLGGGLGERKPSRKPCTSVLDEVRAEGRIGASATRQLRRRRPTCSAHASAKQRTSFCTANQEHKMHTVVPSVTGRSIVSTQRQLSSVADCRKPILGNPALHQKSLNGRRARLTENQTVLYLPTDHGGVP